tara:strand:- start:5882 stop:6325 length:444 start_codon:yes stop_codon:yes gene_type:complete
VNFVALQPWHWLDIPDEARPRRCEDTKGIIALSDTGDMLAACLFDTWTYNSCQIHIYIKDPNVLRHGFQQEVFNYAFKTGGRNVIIGVTPADNPKALKFIRHMGFVNQGIIPDGYKQGVDFVLTTMRAEDCKWLDKPILSVVGENNG